MCAAEDIFIIKQFLRYRFKSTFVNRAFESLNRKSHEITTEVPPRCFVSPNLYNPSCDVRPK